MSWENFKPDAVWACVSVLSMKCPEEKLSIYVEDYSYVTNGPKTVKHDVKWLYSAERDEMLNRALQPTGYGHGTYTLIDYHPVCFTVDNHHELSNVNEESLGNSEILMEGASSKESPNGAGIS